MHDKKLFGTATVGTKGQVVIPADAREEFGIKPGDRLYVVGSPAKAAMVLIKEDQMEEFINRLSLNIEKLKKYKE